MGEKTGFFRAKNLGEGRDQTSVLLSVIYVWMKIHSTWIFKTALSSRYHEYRMVQRIEANLCNTNYESMMIQIHILLSKYESIMK